MLEYAETSLGRLQLMTMLSLFRATPALFFRMFGILVFEGNGRSEHVPVFCAYTMLRLVSGGGGALAGGSLYGSSQMVLVTSEGCRLLAYPQ